MMGEKNIEDSDTDDSDFKIGLEDLSDESSILENDSTNSEVDEIPTSSVKQKIKKRKIPSKKTEILAPGCIKESITNTLEENPDREKERTDLLWENFLNSPDEASKNFESNPDGSTNNSQMLGEKVQKQDSHSKLNKALNSNFTDSKFQEIKTNVCTNSTKPNIFAQQRDLKKKGLSNILSTISKKSKLSTLEKSKQDWNQFKEEHDLNEEITNFNRGKNGYLERQDFLQRTDSRQFEIEKELRHSGKRKTK